MLFKRLSKRKAVEQINNRLEELSKEQKELEKQIINLIEEIRQEVKWD